MKKVFVLCLAFLLALPLFAGCTKKKTTDTPSPDSPAPQSSATESFDHCSELPPTPAEGVLSYKKDKTALTVTVTLKDGADRQVSLLILDGLEHKNDWHESPEHLIDIAQVQLDSEGKGTVSMQLKDENAVCYLLLSTKDGSYSAKING